MRFLTRTGVVALAMMLGSPPATAQMLAFDFDEDGDPRTVRSEIEAEPGAIVEAYLVLGYIPDNQYLYLYAAEFGIRNTTGLEFLGMAAMQDGSLVMQDGSSDRGIDAIAVAFDPIFADDLPIFLMRFAFRVRDAGQQGVYATPAAWDGQAFDRLRLVLGRDDRYEDVDLVEDAHAMGDQRRGVVNQRDGSPTPVEISTWGRIKERYAAETGEVTP